MNADEKLLKKMKAAVKKHENDPEAYHSRLDDHLCKELRALGYEKSVAYFESLNKWYA